MAKARGTKVGLLQDRPASRPAGTGRFYFATDTGILYRDDGIAWKNVSGSFEAGTANGQAVNIKSLTELTTIAAAATTDTTIQMPAGAIILAVPVYVATVIPTAATFTVGDAGSAARFSTAAVTVAAASSDPGTKAGAYYNASAAAVRITPNATPGTATGKVRVTIFYIDITVPTS